MKILKKLATIVSVMCILFVSSCGTTSDKDYTFIMPDGAPALSAVALMKNFPEINGHKVNYKIVAPTTIGADFIQNADIAIMPTNAGAKLFNKGNNIKLLSVNVFGVLYMVGKNEITSLNDLKGEVVYNIGQGNTPDLLLKYFLKHNNIEYVEQTTAVYGKVALAYAAEANEIVGKLKKGAIKFGVLGQPVATKAVKATNSKIVFDFQKEWNKITNNGSYPQAGVVIKNSVAVDKEFVNALYEALNSNLSYIQEKPEEIKGILSEFKSNLTFDFNRAVVDACNIGCKKAQDAKLSLVDYFTKIAEFDAKFIGGKLPADEFYY